MKELSNWLKDDYEIKGSKIVPKTEIKVKIRREATKKEEEIDITDKMWVLGNTTRNNKNLIVSCTKILTHAGALYLKRISGIKFKEGSYNIIKEPTVENLLHGYATIETVDGTMGDGETHKDTLQKSMHPYSFTMLKKRTEDRAILLELGLYEQGFYSDVEVTPDMLAGVEDDIIITDDKKKKLIEQVLTANKYLNQDETALKEFVAGLTGQPVKNIDIHSATTDILAKTYNELNKLCKEELSKRQELADELVGENKKLNRKELLKKHSSELEGVKG